MKPPSSRFAKAICSWPEAAVRKTTHRIGPACPPRCKLAFVTDHLAIVLSSGGHKARCSAVKGDAGLGFGPCLVVVVNMLSPLRLVGVIF